MCNLSDDYYLRKCLLKQNAVPTQSVMRKKMQPPLAAVYFKSMNPRLKELAGLEPSLKGGGNDWYIAPKTLLKGKAVLEPVNKDVLMRLNNFGINILGTTFYQNYHNAINAYVEKTISDSDIKWRVTITANAKETWKTEAARAEKRNNEQFRNNFSYFTYLYRQSLGKIENLLQESAIAEIKYTKEKAVHAMQDKYSVALKYQATMLHNLYEKKLMEEKAKLKADFIEKVEIARTTLADKLHDHNVNKHIAIAQLRQYLKCQNLACEIHVALKEKEEYLKKVEESKRKHQKIVKMMTDTIFHKDVEINLEQQKGKKQQELCNIWQKKIHRVLKVFQTFVSYCLKTLPDYAEFFINLEKLMLLQVANSLDEPTAESVFVDEEKNQEFHEPVLQPYPFYLFCDKGYKSKIDKDLCPKHGGTASTSQLPAIIINKRCLYAACDNFEQFTDNIKDYIYGNSGDDVDIKDDLVYEHFIPVKHASSQQLLEVKLQSSLFNVLQEEIVNLLNIDESLTKCGYCKMPWCTCKFRSSVSEERCDKTKFIKTAKRSFTPTSHKISWTNKKIELDHEREPKQETFLKYVEPKQCHCSKTAKKHLVEHLPVYMRHTRYGPPEIPNYETCSVTTLKTLVREARKVSPSKPPSVIDSKTQDMSTQCDDLVFEKLCTCLTDDKFDDAFNNVHFTYDANTLGLSWVDINTTFGNLSPSYLTHQTSSFATARAYSLRNLVEDMPDIQNIF